MAAILRLQSSDEAVDYGGALTVLVIPEQRGKVLGTSVEQLRRRVVALTAVEVRGVLRPLGWLVCHEFADDALLHKIVLVFAEFVDQRLRGVRSAHRELRLLQLAHPEGVLQPLDLHVMLAHLILLRRADERSLDVCSGSRRFALDFLGLFVLLLLDELLQGLLRNWEARVGRVAGEAKLRPDAEGWMLVLLGSTG